MYFCDYRYKKEIEKIQKPINWFSDKNIEYRENFSNLGDCLNYLNQMYEKGKNSYSLFSWVIYDFERSNFYTGSFKIEEGSSFLELVNIKISNQFKQD